MEHDSKKSYLPDPGNNIKVGGKTIIPGMMHKITSAPAWALPGGGIEHNKRRAKFIAHRICLLRNRK